MSYFGVTSTVSLSPQAAQVQTSLTAPIPPNCGCGFEEVRRIAGSPQAAQGLPCVLGFTDSSASKRRARSSIRAGASLMRRQSPHLSSSARISERTANGFS